MVDAASCLISNNLHPNASRPLYEVIEKILSHTIPLWDTSLVRNRGKRIEYDQVEYLEPIEPEPTQSEGEDEDDFDDRLEEWEARRPINPPEPGEFESREVHPNYNVNLRDMFADKGLQIIVKLANIELTPENPDYDGGSWHVEGQLVSHIW